MTVPIYYTYPFAIDGDRDSINPQNSNPNLISYQNGWVASYQANLADPDSGAQPINRQQTNQMFYDATLNIQQYQQQGTPNWYSADANSASIPYPLYARVLYTDNNVYESQTGANTATPGVDSSWLRVSGSTVMPGTIIDWAGSTVPAGYLNCDGSQVSQTTYSALFAAIGTTWNIGSPSSGNFFLPDLRSYVTAGSGVTLAPLADGNVGTRGGLATTTELVSHTHTATIKGQNTAGSGDGGGLYTTNTSSPSLTGTVVISSQGTGSSATIVQPTAVVMKLIKF
jgi:microcystin-dependent protein